MRSLKSLKCWLRYRYVKTLGLKNLLKIKLNGSLAGRSNFVQVGEEENWEDPTGEGSSDEINDTISSGSGKYREWSGQEDLFVDENEQTVAFLLVTDGYEQRLHSRQVADK